MNKLKGHCAFLSGPIDRCPNGGRLWRIEITKFLNSMEIGALNPCSKPIINEKYDEDDDFVNKVNKLKHNGYYEELRKVMKNIVRADLSLVDRCDFLIAHINSEIPMCGTFSEIHQATLERKPVIIHSEHGLKTIPNWLYGLCNHQLFFSSWDEVKNYIKMVAYNDIDDMDGKWKFLDYIKIFGNKK